MCHLAGGQAGRPGLSLPFDRSVWMFRSKGGSLLRFDFSSLCLLWKIPPPRNVYDFFSLLSTLGIWIKLYFRETNLRVLGRKPFLAGAMHHCTLSRIREIFRAWTLWNQIDKYSSTQICTLLVVHAMCNTQKLIETLMVDCLPFPTAWLER